MASWRTCPACKGRATKLFHLKTGRYTCQQCGHEYVHKWEQHHEELAAKRRLGAPGSKREAARLLKERLAEERALERASKTPTDFSERAKKSRSTSKLIRS